MKNIEEIKQELEQKKKLTVAFHHDADGVASLVLAKYVLDIDEVYAPDIFGDYKEEDLALDLGKPINNGFKGVIIDHHVHDANPPYKLIWDNVPTGLIIYNLWRDKIPKKDTWKTLVSIVGDGQPQLIPHEVIDEHPYLLDKVGSMYKSYGKLKLYTYPLYVMLSSPINSMCRCGNVLQAYRLLLRARYPEDLLKNEIAKNDTNIVRKEEDRIFQEYNKIDTIRDCCVFYRFRSKLRMCGRVASKLASAEPNKTIIALNEEKGSMSIRGHLASYIGDNLNKLGFTIGGHQGFMGGRLQDNQTGRDLLEALRKIL